MIDLNTWETLALAAQKKGQLLPMEPADVLLLIDQTRMAPPEGDKSRADLEWLAELRLNLRTQDNRITSYPMFIVEQRKRLYGLDPEYADEDGIAWMFDSEEWPKDDPDRIEAEAEYDSTGEEPDGWTRTGFIDQWEFVTACFTEQGCQDYLELNGHNLGKTRIFVESGHRNEEWQRLRKLLLKGTGATLVVAQKDYDYLFELQEAARDGNARLGPMTRAALIDATIIKTAPKG